MDEYQDQTVWYELYEIYPKARHPFQHQGFVKDFDSRKEAEDYAADNIPDGVEYRIKRVTGLPD